MSSSVGMSGLMCIMLHTLGIYLRRCSERHLDKHNFLHTHGQLLTLTFLKALTFMCMKSFLHTLCTILHLVAIYESDQKQNFCTHTHTHKHAHTYTYTHTESSKLESNTTMWAKFKGVKIKCIFFKFGISSFTSALKAVSNLHSNYTTFYI